MELILEIIYQLHFIDKLIYDRQLLNFIYFMKGEIWEVYLKSYFFSLIMFSTISANVVRALDEVTPLENSNLELENVYIGDAEYNSNDYSFDSEGNNQGLELADDEFIEDAENLDGNPMYAERGTWGMTQAQSGHAIARIIVYRLHYRYSTVFFKIC